MSGSDGNPLTISISDKRLDTAALTSGTHEMTSVENRETILSYAADLGVADVAELLPLNLWKIADAATGAQRTSTSTPLFQYLNEGGGGGAFVVVYTERP